MNDSPCIPFNHQHNDYKIPAIQTHNCRIDFSKGGLITLFGLAGSETGNEYRTLSNYFSFAKTPMRALPSTSQ